MSGARKATGCLPDEFPVKTMRHRLRNIRKLIAKFEDHPDYHNVYIDLMLVEEFIDSLKRLVPKEKE